MKSSYNVFAAENRCVKKYYMVHHIERVLPMTKRFTREQQLQNLKLQNGSDLIRSFQIALNCCDADNEQSLWEYNAVKQELLRRLSY